jgi:hypothetical protein
LREVLTRAYRVPGRASEYINRRGITVKVSDDPAVSEEERTS